jgi:hypothetical protein
VPDALTTRTCNRQNCLQGRPPFAVEVLAAAPFDGPVTVRVVGKKNAIAREVRADIGVD